ncbi:MAG: helix-turn-helix domain-containing protein, partial [Clostridiales bacterium]|nr:helix-turn-helix domain-containing protein [Clostridiales bacterium]
MKKDLGYRLRLMRELNRMTRERLAEVVDLSVSYVGLIERGLRTPSLDKLTEMCEVLHASLDYIVKGSTESVLTKLPSVTMKTAGVPNAST